MPHIHGLQKNEAAALSQRGGGNGSLLETKKRVHSRTTNAGVLGGSTLRGLTPQKKLVALRGFGRA
jgi:hypothetical protein